MKASSGFEWIRRIVWTCAAAIGSWSTVPPRVVPGSWIEDPRSGASAFGLLVRVRDR